VLKEIDLFVLLKGLTPASGTLKQDQHLLIAYSGLKERTRGTAADRRHDDCFTVLLMLMQLNGRAHPAQAPVAFYSFGWVTHNHQQ
jgi:hypothetical protein